MSSHRFFEGKKAAAIFKHAVLDQYVNPFVGKTGKTSADHRVAFVDGYAGEGRYEDGAEGSPALLLRKAREMAPGRQLECYMVEKSRAKFDRLREVIAKEGTDVVAEPFHGEASVHLPGLLERTAGVPTFFFLDPCGLLVPLDVIATIFDRPRGLGAPATEVLLNFSAVGLRRIAGLLHVDDVTPPMEATLESMDGMCGGTWWRDTWLAHAPTKDAAEEERRQAELAVVNEYARRLGKLAKAGFWTFDVRNRSHHLPAYYLVFVSRHPDGMELFGEALSLGQKRWRRAVFDAEADGAMFATDDDFKAEEKGPA